MPHALVAVPVAVRAPAARVHLSARRAVARPVYTKNAQRAGCFKRAVLRVRADATDATVEGPGVDSELEAVAAAVEALRLENEKLRMRLQTDGEAADVAFTKLSWAKPDFSNFQYPPVTGDGWGILAHDHLLNNHREHLGYRWNRYKELRGAIDQHEGGLEKFSRGYEKMGFTKTDKGVHYREWAPSAQQAYLFGDFNSWNTTSHKMEKDGFGTFNLLLANNADGTSAIPHGTRVKIRLQGPGGDWLDRIPAWISYAVQAPGEIPFNGVYYDPPVEERHVFEHPRPMTPKALRIYEAHVGMSSIEPKISTYSEFRDTVLPRVKYLGYNAVQLMAIQEHAYYACFGYHVTNFFGVSSRCGTPDDLKALIDRAHELGILVLMDIVHSHASSNANDGINMFDGSDGQYFHQGSRGYHWMWDSRCFNYGSWEVLRFLLSNLRYWVEEFNFDGFRFDGVTSMMYTHHGLSVAFTGNYKEYFGMATDTDAMVYLMLANDMLHSLYPEQVVTIAEDVSGMPTLCRPVSEGGIGFDYRLQMAIADKWIEVLGKWGPDEAWDMGNLVFTMENRRYGEKCIGYAESHDQALVGDKTIAFWLMDAEMYEGMSLLKPASPVVERGVALHKMIRAFTMGLGGEGYLNFMGNEFGHPEWIDFPREDRYEASTGKFVPGNGNSYHLCRRRFDLADMDHLRYKYLYDFDAALNSAENITQWLSSGHQWVSKKCDTDKLIVFERGDAVFVFNWHYTKSYTGYRVGCKHPGKYKILLNSDNPAFGGWGNVKDATEFYAEGGHDARPHSLLVYAPARTIVVYAPAEYLEKKSDPLEEFCEGNPSEPECLVYDDSA